MNDLSLEVIQQSAERLRAEAAHDRLARQIRAGRKHRRFFSRTK